MPGILDRDIDHLGITELDSMQTYCTVARLHRGLPHSKSISFHFIPCDRFLLSICKTFAVAPESAIAFTAQTLVKPSALLIERADSSSLQMKMHNSAASSTGSSRRASSDRFGFSGTDESMSLASTPCSLENTADVRSDVARPDPDGWQDEERKENAVSEVTDVFSASSPPADYSEAADQLRRHINMQYLVGGNRIRLRGARGRHGNGSKLQPIVEVKTPQQLSGPINAINQDKTRGASPRVLLARGIGNVQFALSIRTQGLESSQGPTLRQQSVKITPFPGQVEDDDVYYYSSTTSTCNTDFWSAPTIAQVDKEKCFVISEVVSDSAASTGEVREEKSLVLAGVASGELLKSHSFDTVAVGFWLAELSEGTFLSSVKEGGEIYSKARRYSIKVTQKGEVLLRWKVRGVLGSVQHNCELVATKAVDISALQLQLLTTEAILYVQAPSRETFEVWTAGMTSIFAYSKTLSAQRKRDLAKCGQQKWVAHHSHSLKSFASLPSNTL